MRKPDIFDEILLCLRENQEADTTLAPETLNTLFSSAEQKQTASTAPPAVAPAPVRQPAAPAPMPAAPAAVPVSDAGSSQPPVQCRNMGWEELSACAQNCFRCPLGRTRTNVVFGEGPQNAQLMFIGEGPGADEDAQGRPFVGRAGELLTKMISAMQFDRFNEVYIGNIVKCRPPGNRTPFPEEADVCKPIIMRQIELIRPKVIVLLGATPLLYLLGMKGITKLRGTWLDYNGIKVMPTFHPAFLLRDPRRKADVWQDLQLVMREFGKTPPAPHH